VNTQAIVDAEIAAARGVLDFWWYDFYPVKSILAGTGDEIVNSYINDALDAHLASANKVDIKFAVALQPNQLSYAGSEPLWTYYQAQLEYVRDVLFADTQYQKINGIPLVGFINTSVANFPDDKVATMVSTLGNFWGVHLYHSASECARITNCKAIGSYGPISAPSGNGQHAFTEQETVNRALWVIPPGLQAVAITILLQDKRPFAPVSPWVDKPTQPQLIAHMREAINAPSVKLVDVHAWSEITESGPGITPTVQEGTRFLDAIKIARTGVVPGSTSYELGCETLQSTEAGVVRSGAGWSYVQPAIVGSHSGDEECSSTTDDYVELTHPRWTTAGLYANKGPDRGIVDVIVDSSPVASPDLYAASPTAHQLVWTSSLSDASHTVRFRVTGTKNASSSSVKVCPDTWQITYRPQ